MGWRVTGIGQRALDQEGYIRHDLSQPLPDNLGPFDAVVHAAARSSPWGRRSDFHRQNVVATRNVIDYCREHGQPKLIFVSSLSVYYRPLDQFNITESTPLADRGANEYASSKIKAESLVQQYPGTWAILRPRSVFGPGDTVLFPRILRAARAGKLPLLTRPGDPTMGDMIYIDNFTDHVAATVTNPTIQGCFNLTNHETVPILAFLLDVLKRLDIPLPTKKVSVRTAWMAAWALEHFYALCLPNREPPLTRFGVHILAYSKTFDVTKMLATFGPPRISLTDGVSAFVESVKASGS